MFGIRDSSVIPVEAGIYTIENSRTWIPVSDRCQPEDDNIKEKIASSPPPRNNIRLGKHHNLNNNLDLQYGICLEQLG